MAGFEGVDPEAQVYDAQVEDAGVVVTVVIGVRQHVAGVQPLAAHTRAPGCGRRFMGAGQAKFEHVGAGVVVTVGVKQHIAGEQPLTPHTRRPGCGRSIIDPGQANFAHVKTGVGVVVIVVTTRSQHLVGVQLARQARFCDAGLMLMLEGQV